MPDHHHLPNYHVAIGLIAARRAHVPPLPPCPVNHSSVVNAGDYDSITRKVQRLDEEVKEDVLVLKVRQKLGH